MTGQIVPGRAVIRLGRAGEVMLKRSVDEKRRADKVMLVAGCRVSVCIPMYSPDLARNKTNTRKKN
jgi:hypothetical protein